MGPDWPGLSWATTLTEAAGAGNTASRDNSNPPSNTRFCMRGFPSRADPLVNEKSDAMKRSDTRILTTHAGSLPRPETLNALFAKKSRGEAVDADELLRLCAVA